MKPRKEIIDLYNALIEDMEHHIELSSFWGRDVESLHLWIKELKFAKSLYISNIKLYLYLDIARNHHYILECYGYDFSYEYDYINFDDENN